jgi:hypothetical protein
MVNLTDQPQGLVDVSLVDFAQFLSSIGLVIG